MSDQPQHSIPSLVGGFPTQADFVPSILFAVAYGLSIIPFIIRFMNPNSRTYTFAIGTLAYSVERVVVWSIRASQSHDHHLGETLSKGRLVYQQVSFALGFIGFGTDCVAFMRAALVNTTLEDPKRGSVDKARARFWSRRAADLAGLVWMISSVPGGVGYSKMPRSFDHPEDADKLFRLRYVSASAALFLFVFYIVVLRYIRNRIEWLDKRAVDCTCGILSLASVVAIYRLTVLHNRTSVLNVLPSTPPLYPPGSLTTTASKATFYIFHALPELIIAWFILSLNLRALFNTGPFGDWRGSDERVGTVRLREKGVYLDGVGVPKNQDN
ncbi:hypothetical protein FRC04_006119 [Tulasnella sp. 424]|nr:hypothetical protein FRC04_006119 [Tulasnella sp. 424]KAG8972239.1 hypothetical protein FRC05_010182 [Tulasnella sp. 425]